MMRAAGGDYYDPDEAARELLAANPKLGPRDANSLAWHEGRRLLERAIAERGDLALETSLGGATIARLLHQAASVGMAVHVWYAALATVELHVARVRARVARGGHDVPEHDIRRRYDASRL